MDSGFTLYCGATWPLAEERNLVNTTHTTNRVAPFVEALMPHGKKLRAFGAARAALETLIGWAQQEEPAAAGLTPRAREANVAREYALKFSRTDPRFAADLYAAADRHEIGESA
jgi:hypothetical protein